MVVEFANGTDEQKKTTIDVLGSLLHYDYATAPLSLLRISFVPNPSPDSEHEFAATESPIDSGTYSYDHGEAGIKIRSTAPRFQPPWDTIQFYNETVAHEFGHAVFANLPSVTRDAIARMFGAKDASLETISDPDKPWGKRVSEGIAETFKEAFLPSRFRAFPNRTSRRISYTLYPRFRELFRGDASPSGQGFNYVYGSSSYRVDLSEWWLTELPYHHSENDDEAFVFYEWIKGFEDCWGVNMSQFKESGELPFSIEPEGTIAS